MPHHHTQEHYMGTYTGFASKAEVIRELHAFSPQYVLEKSCDRGSNHWMLVRRLADQHLFVALALISNYRGDWGYKPLDESMGLYEVNCPLGYIQACEAPGQPPAEGYAAKWREQVKAYHARRVAA